MNHIYRSIWNATLGCWVAVSETARAVRSHSSSVQPLSTCAGVRILPVVVASLVGAVACAMLPVYAQTYTGTDVLDASTANAVSGGSQGFYHTSSLNATAANAVSGGRQDFYFSSSLNATVANAVSGASIRLSDSAFIDVNANNALSKGATINFYSVNVASKLQLNGYSTIVGAIYSLNAGAGALRTMAAMQRC